MTERTNNETKRRMLAAIRQHLTASEPFDRVHNERKPHEQKTEILAAETTFQQTALIAAAPAAQNDSLVENFKSALEAIGGNCRVVANEAAAAKIVELIIEKTGVRRAAISDSPLVAKVRENLQTNREIVENASAAELFDCDLGITGAQWAIAETGTLVLESDKERHRLASLVPAIHVCLISANRIRQTLGEVLSFVGGDLSRTITFVTGPSRTSDIELTLAIGVHGPGELHAIVINKAEPSAAAGDQRRRRF